MDSFKQKGYKFVSTSAAAIENLAIPSVKHSTQIMIEGTNQICTGINGFYDECDRGTGRKMSWLFSGLKKLNEGAKKIATMSLVANYHDSMNNLNIIERGLNTQQTSLEKYFEDNGINVHENWVFNLENRETIRDIYMFIRHNTRETDIIPYHRIWQYFMAYVIVQKRARNLV